MKGVCSQEPQPSTPTLIAISPRALSEQCLLLRSCSALLRTLYTESAQYIHTGLPWWLPSKESVCSAWDSGSIPGLGGSAGEGKGNPLQYSCLGNPMDRGAWWATVLGFARVRHELVTKQQQCLITKPSNIGKVRPRPFLPCLYFICSWEIKMKN